MYLSADFLISKELSNRPPVHALPPDWRYFSTRRRIACRAVKATNKSNTNKNSIRDVSGMSREGIHQLYIALRRRNVRSTRLVSSRLRQPLAKAR